MPAHYRARHPYRDVPVVELASLPKRLLDVTPLGPALFLVAWSALRLVVAVASRELGAEEVLACAVLCTCVHIVDAELRSSAPGSALTAP
jgi:hypothetical protein